MEGERMKKLSKVVVVLVMVCLLAGASSAAPADNLDTSRKIVVFQSGVSKQVQNDVITNAGADVIKKLPLINAAVVTADSASEAALLAQPEVLRIEEDALAYTQDAGESIPTSKIQVLPWNMERINSNLVWDQDQDGIIDNNAGEGVKVAVLDSGINLSHPDLRDNIYGGYNAIDPRKAPEDTFGHGTHVAGIFAGINNEIGVIGTAPKANLYAVKVIDVNSGYISDVIEGLQWCIDNGMQVVNMSIGLPEDIDALHEAITAAYEQGIVLVAAAGNYGPIL
jgi:subtilisin family serine protease